MFSRSLILLWATAAVQCTNILLSNDDGWAVAQIRAQNDALKAAGFSVRMMPQVPFTAELTQFAVGQVVLSAPAENKSGTGSSTTTPTPLTQECEFDTCPVGSPAEGFNASDRQCSFHVGTLGMPVA